MPSTLFAILQYVRMCLYIDVEVVNERPQYLQVGAGLLLIVRSKIGSHGVLRARWRCSNAGLENNFPHF